MHYLLLLLTLFSFIPLHAADEPPLLNTAILVENELLAKDTELLAKSPESFFKSASTPDGFTINYNTVSIV